MTFEEFDSIIAEAMATTDRPDGFEDWLFNKTDKLAEWYETLKEDASVVYWLHILIATEQRTFEVITGESDFFSGNSIAIRAEERLGYSILPPHKFVDWDGSIT